MRPAGEIREEILKLIEAQGPKSLRSLQELLPIQTTKEAIANTVENAVRAGVLEKVGSEKQAHCYKWVALYGLPEQLDVQADVGTGVGVLCQALGAWRPLAV
jgi:hypothetical protein